MSTNLHLVSLLLFQGINPRIHYTLQPMTGRYKLYDITQDGILIAKTNRLRAFDRHILEVTKMDVYDYMTSQELYMCLIHTLRASTSSWRDHWWCNDLFCHRWLQQMRNQARLLMLHWTLRFYRRDNQVKVFQPIIGSNMDNPENTQTD